VLLPTAKGVAAHRKENNIDEIKSAKLLSSKLRHEQAANKIQLPHKTIPQDSPNKPQRKPLLAPRLARRGDLDGAAGGLVALELDERLGVVDGTLDELQRFSHVHVALEDPKALVNDVERRVLLAVLHHNVG
jgi:hypothetical protein